MARRDGAYGDVMKIKQRWIWLSTLLVFCVLPMMCQSSFNEISSGMAYYSESPAGRYTATIIETEDFFTTRDFYVWDVNLNIQPESKVIYVAGGYSHDGQKIFEQSFWSNDGSLFAVKGVARTTQVETQYFLDAYDFRFHKRIMPDIELNLTNVKRKSKQIAELFHQRGGIQKSDKLYGLNVSERNLDYAKRKKYLDLKPSR